MDNIIKTITFKYNKFYKSNYITIKKYYTEVEKKWKST